MSKTVSVPLDERAGAIIDAEIAAGRFHAPEEVVAAGLALLQERQAKLERLRELIREGEESGEPIPLDRETLFAEMRAERRANALNAKG